jgi:hypothetical protein
MAKPQPLEERITQIRDEIDRFLDEKVVEVKADCPGVPPGVIRNILMARSGGCLCAAYRNIIEQDAAA